MRNDYYALICTAFTICTIVTPIYAEEDLSGADDAVPCAIGGIDGPADVYVYVSTGNWQSNDRFTNTFGKFILSANPTAGGNAGTASYHWNGIGDNGRTPQPYNETLIYKSSIFVEDPRSDTDASVDAWLYELRGPTGDFRGWIAFGQNELQGMNRTRYPVYYATAPGVPTQMKRMLTRSGTQRF